MSKWDAVEMRCNPRSLIYPPPNPDPRGRGRGMVTIDNEMRAIDYVWIPISDSRSDFEAMTRAVCAGKE